MSSQTEKIEKYKSCICFVTVFVEEVTFHYCVISILNCEVTFYHSVLSIIICKVTFHYCVLSILICDVSFDLVEVAYETLHEKKKPICLKNAAMKYLFQN